MIAFAPTDEDLDADHELPPPAVLSAPTEGGKRVAPTGRSGRTEASIALASAGPSTSGTGPTGRSVRAEAGIGVAGAGPSTGVTGSAGSSTHTEASTPVTGAGPSRSRRQRVTPPSHNAEVRRLLQDVVDQLKTHAEVVKNSEVVRAHHSESLIKELRRFNDNYESMHGKKSRKRRHESDSD